MLDRRRSEPSGLGGEQRGAETSDGTGSTGAEREAKTVPMHGAKRWAGAHVL